MSDTPTPELAGSDSAPAPIESTTPASAEERLAKLFGPGDQDTDDTLAGDESDDPPEGGEAPDSDGDEPDDQGGDEAPEQSGDEEPADDAAEPEDEKGSERTAHGNQVAILRDGQRVRVSDLKQSFDQLQEIETKVLPQVRERLQSFAQEQQAFQSQQQQFQPVLASVAEILQAQIPPAPPDELWEADPLEAQLQERRHLKAVQKLQQINQTRAQNEHQAKARYESELTQSAHQAVARFVESQPELKDPSKGQAFYKDFQDVAAFVGYSREEAAKVYDPRLYRMAQLAAIGKKSLEQGKKTETVTTQKRAIADRKVVGKPPVAPPAPRQSASTRGEAGLRQAKERLHKTGSAADGIAALTALGF